VHAQNNVYDQYKIQCVIGLVPCDLYLIRMFILEIVDSQDHFDDAGWLNLSQDLVLQMVKTAM